MTKSPAEESHTITVMTYNVLFNTSDEATLEVLRETGADIIGLQEASSSRLAKLARDLRYHYHSFPKTTGNLSSQDTGILSRFPIASFLQELTIHLKRI